MLGKKGELPTCNPKFYFSKPTGKNEERKPHFDFIMKRNIYINSLAKCNIKI